MRGAYSRRVRRALVLLALPIAITVSSLPALADSGPTASDIAPDRPSTAEQHGKKRDRSKAGVPPRCRKHARERTPSRPCVKTSHQKRPVSKLKITGRTATSATFVFEVDKPANVYYTLDGRRPTFDSRKLWAAGRREGTRQITVDKTTEVSWFSVDVAGNVEKNYKPTGNGKNYNRETVKVAGRAPVTTATVTPAQPAGGWFTGPVSVRLSATAGKDGKKVERTEYRLDDGAWTRYTTPIAVTGDGSHTLAYRSVDKGGHVEAARTLTVKVDATAPRTTSTAGSPDNGGVPVTFSATDETSGVERIEYSLDGGTWTPYTETVNVTGEGDHALRYRATDRAGNVEEIRTRTVTVPTAPAIPLTVTAQSRCVGATAHVAVTAVNNGTVPATITLSTPYGSRTVADVAPGSQAYQSFNARTAQLTGGTVTVTGAATVDGRPVTSTYEATYNTFGCG